jgi:hypothetical protein
VPQATNDPSKTARPGILGRELMLPCLPARQDNATDGPRGSPISDGHCHPLLCHLSKDSTNLNPDSDGLGKLMNLYLGTMPMDYRGRNSDA